jgi:hypothetical protein
MNSNRELRLPWAKSIRRIKNLRAINIAYSFHLFIAVDV